MSSSSPLNPDIKIHLNLGDQIGEQLKKGILVSYERGGGSPAYFEVSDLQNLIDGRLDENSTITQDLIDKVKGVALPIIKYISEQEGIEEVAVSYKLEEEDSSCWKREKATQIKNKVTEELTVESTLEEADKAVNAYHQHMKTHHTIKNEELQKLIKGKDFVNKSPEELKKQLLKLPNSDKSTIENPYTYLLQHPDMNTSLKSALKEKAVEKVDKQLKEALAPFTSFNKEAIEKALKSLKQVDLEVIDFCLSHHLLKDLEPFLKYAAFQGYEGKDLTEKLSQEQKNAVEKKKIEISTTLKSTEPTPPRGKSKVTVINPSSHEKGGDAVKKALESIFNVIKDSEKYSTLRGAFEKIVSSPPQSIIDNLESSLDEVFKGQMQGFDEASPKEASEKFAEIENNLNFLFSEAEKNKLENLFAKTLFKHVMALKYFCREEPSFDAKIKKLSEKNESLLLRCDPPDFKRFTWIWRKLVRSIEKEVKAEEMSPFSGIIKRKEFMLLLQKSSITKDASIFKTWKDGFYREEDKAYWAPIELAFLCLPDKFIKEIKEGEHLRESLLQKYMANPDLYKLPSTQTLCLKRLQEVTSTKLPTSQESLALCLEKLDRTKKTIADFNEAKSLEDCQTAVDKVHEQEPLLLKELAKQVFENISKQGAIMPGKDEEEAFKRRAEELEKFKYQAQALSKYITADRGPLQFKGTLRDLPYLLCCFLSGDSDKQNQALQNFILMARERLDSKVSTERCQTKDLYTLAFNLAKYPGLRLKDYNIAEYLFENLLEKGKHFTDYSPDSRQVDIKYMHKAWDEQIGDSANFVFAKTQIKHMFPGLETKNEKEHSTTVDASEKTKAQPFSGHLDKYAKVIFAKDMQRKMWASVKGRDLAKKDKAKRVRFKLEKPIDSERDVSAEKIFEEITNKMKQLKSLATDKKQALAEGIYSKISRCLDRCSQEEKTILNQLEKYCEQLTELILRTKELPLLTSNVDQLQVLLYANPKKDFSAYRDKVGGLVNQAISKQNNGVLLKICLNRFKRSKAAEESSLSMLYHQIMTKLLDNMSTESIHNTYAEVGGFELDIGTDLDKRFIDEVKLKFVLQKYRNKEQHTFENYRFILQHLSKIKRTYPMADSLAEEINEAKRYYQDQLVKHYESLLSESLNNKQLEDHLFRLHKDFETQSLDEEPYFNIYYDLYCKYYEQLTSKTNEDIKTRIMLELRAFLRNSEKILTLSELSDLFEPCQRVGVEGTYVSYIKTILALKYQEEITKLAKDGDKISKANTLKKQFLKDQNLIQDPEKIERKLEALLKS